MENVIAGVIVSGLFSLAGIWYATRSQSRSQTFDTLVKAYEAVSEDNQRLRIENARLEQQQDAERRRCDERITDLERQLARAYRNRPDTGPLGGKAGGG